ncbi:MAG: TIGR00266 family protein [Chlorobi bacterium]|nr:TIGR00266 family protein [Chlorobiota bacterium]
MKYTISGEIAQFARLEFGPGEPVWSSRGAIMTYTDGVTWELKIPGGLSGAVKRSFAGEGIALTRITAQKPEQVVLLATSAPGHIMVWDLADGPVITTRGSFLAAWGNQIDINVTIARKAGAAFFGGSGLLLQKVSGQGFVLIHASGDFEERVLDAKETILVSTGHLAAFAEGVDYDIKGVGGCRKMLFGGEGLFMTKLTGPGKVLLQTLKRHVQTQTSSSR